MTNTEVAAALQVAARKIALLESRGWRRVPRDDREHPLSPAMWTRRGCDPVTTGEALAHERRRRNGRG
jgi:hypothetical protein